MYACALRWKFCFDWGTLFKVNDNNGRQFMNDQINPEESAAGQVDPAADPGGIDDIDISNKGQRIAVILVMILILAAAGGGFMVFAGKQRKKENFEKLKKDIAAAHNKGYETFWKNVQIDLKVMKTNKDFQAKLTEYLKVSSIAYAKHVKKEGLPVLEAAIPKYKALESYGVVIPEIKALTFSLEKLLGVWQKFSDEVLLYEDYLSNRSRLDTLGAQWMTAQQNPKDEKAKAGAAQYVKIVNCILRDKSIIDYDPWDLSLRIKDTCAKADEQSDWFKRVAFGCLDAAANPVAPDAVYDATVEKYHAIEVDNQDTKSIFGIKQCLDLSRATFEMELSDNIAAAWADYVKKKIALSNAVKNAIKEI
jgi:hypothetical protein